VEEELKAMKKIVDTVAREWPKLSVAARTYVRYQLETMDLDAPVDTRSDVEKERV